TRVLRPSRAAATPAESPAIPPPTTTTSYSLSNALSPSPTAGLAVAAFRLTLSCADLFALGEQLADLRRHRAVLPWWSTPDLAAIDLCLKLNAGVFAGIAEDVHRFPAVLHGLDVVREHLAEHCDASVRKARSLLVTAGDGPL